MEDWKRCYELEVNQLASELRCFYTRHSHEEDVLGMPIAYTVNPRRRYLPAVEK